MSTGSPELFRGIGVGSGSLAWRFCGQTKVIHVIHHGNEQVEKQLTAVFHLVLHRAATLERVASTDDECEVVRTELGVVVRCVGVGVTSRSQDGRALDARLQTLLAESQLLQLLEPVLLGLAVDHGVLEDGSRRRVDHCLVGTVVVAAVFQSPGVALLVELETRVVIALVQVLEDRRENLGLLVGEIDTLVGGLVELATACSLEVRRVRQNILVCCEETLLSSYAYCDDGADELSVKNPRLHRDCRCSPSQ